MSDSAKKPDDNFEERTAIMTDPMNSPDIKLNLNMDDDVIDENFSFDQKTVVQSTGVNLPPPLVVAQPPPIEKPQVPEPPSGYKPFVSGNRVSAPVKDKDADAQTGSFRITNPKINPVAAPKADTVDEKTAITSAAPAAEPAPSRPRASKGAVKIDAVPPMPEIPPGEELEFEKKRKGKKSGQVQTPEFVQNLLGNKRALAGIAVAIIGVVAFIMWKSHQPRNIDLRRDESSPRPPATQDAPPANAAAQMPTAEQAASRFEMVFQKVQSDGGDVSR